MPTRRPAHQATRSSAVVTICALLWITVTAVWVVNLLDIIGLLTEEHDLHREAQAFARADDDATSALLSAVDPYRWGQVSTPGLSAGPEPALDPADDWPEVVAEYEAASQRRSEAAASVLTALEIGSGTARDDLSRVLTELQERERSVLLLAGEGQVEVARAVLTSAPYAAARAQVVGKANRLDQMHTQLITDATGRAYVVMVVGALVSTGCLMSLLYVVTMDVRRRRQAQSRIAGELEARLSTDFLTGTRTREAFITDLTSAWDEHPASRGQVVHVDIEHFGRLNEEYGHRRADAVLCAVADLMSDVFCQRDGSSLARMGADSFAVLLPQPTSAAEAQAGAAKVMRTLSTPLPITLDARQEHVPVQVAVGIAQLPADPDQDAAADALRHAETAAGRAGTQDGCRVRRFDAVMLAEEQLARELVVALDAGEIIAHYQPVWRVQDDGSVQVEGVEALARWDHPRLGAISPGVFVPLAAQMKRERRLTQLMLDQACRQLATWRYRLGPAAPSYVAVNVGVTEVDADLPALVQEVTHRHSLPASCLLLEITEETAALQPEVAADVCARLRRLGARLAVDDFGTGYSSLHRLNSLGFDVLKIDRSLTDGISDAMTAPLLDATLAMAHGLGATSVVEGVETWEQFDYLLARGASAVQGFLFSPPRSAADIEELLLGGITVTGHDTRLPRPRRAQHALGQART